VSRAIVVGGGVAGLVAAFGLRERGHDVTLLESRRWLGGRAFSSPDPVTGRVLDNGGHVMLGCYAAMRRLVRRLGTEGGFAAHRSLAMAYRTREGRSARLALGPLPVPLAMPFALGRLPMSMRERFAALRGMAAVLRRAPDDWSFGDWLRRHGQLGAPDAWFWRPLCRAVMNVEPDLAAANDFLATLREAFAGTAGHAAFHVPMRPWSELVGAPALRALVAAGVVVRTGVRVTGVRTADGAIAALETSANEVLPVGVGDLVVAAMPWFALHALLPTVAPGLPTLPSSPITSAFVETAPGVSPLPDDGPVVALVDGDPFHFVLRTPGGDPRCFSLLSGGSRAFDGQSVDAVAALARAQLASCYPDWRGLDGASIRIRREQHATFVAAPGARRHRPRPGRSAQLANLWLCGDWTDIGLPATLEGAARSAEAMLAQLPRGA